MRRTNWHIKDYDKKRATGEDFKKQVFLGYINGKKHFSIGRASVYFDQRPPEDEVWDYEYEEVRMYD